MSELRRHLVMALARSRVQAYEKALRRVVTPETVVADVGAGSGLLSVLAAQAGARRVYAIEPAPVGDLVPEIAESNHVGDVVQLIRSPAEVAELPEDVDLVVFDLRGTLPLVLDRLSALATFCSRWLRAGGAIVPERDRLFVACASVPKERSRLSSRTAGPVDIRPLTEAVAQTWWRVDLDEASLMTPGRIWGEIEYPWSPASLGSSVAWSFDERTSIDGLVCWFEGDLGGDCAVSSRPGPAGGPYGQAFFPLKSTVLVKPGDELKVDLRVDPIGDRLTWSWVTRVDSSQGPSREFRQSSFWAEAPEIRRRLEASTIGASIGSDPDR